MDDEMGLKDTRPLKEAPRPKGKPIETMSLAERIMRRLIAPRRVSKHAAGRKLPRSARAKRKARRKQAKASRKRNRKK